MVPRFFVNDESGENALVRVFNRNVSSVLVDLVLFHSMVVYCRGDGRVCGLIEGGLGAAV